MASRLGIDCSCRNIPFHIGDMSGIIVKLRSFRALQMDALVICQSMFDLLLEVGRTFREIKYEDLWKY